MDVQKIEKKDGQEEVKLKEEKTMPSKLETKISSFSEEENKKPFLIGIALIILVGVVSGYFLSRRGVTLPGKGGDAITSKKSAGSKDTSVFKDQAEGKIEKGGLNGEGSHKLLREGGPSQTAYLTSSVVDLDQFVGKEVKVWGETFAGEKASWLMDVGRVEVLE
ncbi:hypothetical protein ISS85_03030 [Candidatus Microgenomates bacterium]|nr:hypothetical protein [Candidatus Microgenomates bacterium]